MLKRLLLTSLLCLSHEAFAESIALSCHTPEQSTFAVFVSSKETICAAAKRGLKLSASFTFSRLDSQSSDDLDGTLLPTCDLNGAITSFNLDFAKTGAVFISFQSGLNGSAQLANHSSLRQMTGITRLDAECVDLPPVGLPSVSGGN